MVVIFLCTKSMLFNNLITKSDKCEVFNFFNNHLCERTPDDNNT